MLISARGERLARDPAYTILTAKAARVEGVGGEIEVETPTGGGAEKHRRGGAGEGEGGRAAKTVGWGAVEGEIPAA